MIIRLTFPEHYDYIFEMNRLRGNITLVINDEIQYIGSLSLFPFVIMTVR